MGAAGLDLGDILTHPRTSGFDIILKRCQRGKHKESARCQHENTDGGIG